MKFSLEFSKSALEDIQIHRKSGDRPTLKKNEKLLNELLIHPTIGTGKPEVLKYNEKNLYSRRINKQHRLIYSINESLLIVYVLSLRSHYGDK